MSSEFCFIIFMQMEMGKLLSSLGKKKKSMVSVIKHFTTVAVKRNTALEADY